jgi:light-regulated signal transduction histidine kinase (bacteriophytochrome)
MITGEPLVCNNLPDHPDRVGQPKGHIPMDSFLSVPVKCDGKVTGMVAVANKPEGYTEADVATLTRLVDVMVVSRQHRELLSEAQTTSAELEQRVIQRTTELEAANKELEAFAFSVSHDLRAPLRAIDGYAKILVEDFPSQLGDEGKRLCSILSDNARKMGKLIDDLLTFSRLGRTEMQLSRVDMGTLANSIFHELTTPESRARIDFQVESAPKGFGDPILIRQVWMNLLSNAVKFSSKRERSVIVVRGEIREDEIIYSVQDNGAGFDMKYIDKLFGVFQRLHSTREFEGTGVGLAIVQRIIHRHGGRVWAEGATDKGATFYFTLKHKGSQS